MPIKGHRTTGLGAQTNWRKKLWREIKLPKQKAKVKGTPESKHTHKKEEFDLKSGGCRGGDTNTTNTTNNNYNKINKTLNTEKRCRPLEEAGGWACAELSELDQCVRAIIRETAHHQRWFEHRPGLVSLVLATESEGKLFFFLELAHFI